MNNILKTFQKSSHPLFISFINIGDPDISSSEKFIFNLVNAGVDILELGVPFSDPVADGITNQLSSQRALKHGNNILKILDFIKSLRNKGLNTPIILYSYYNPILSIGLKNFVSLARKSNIDGILVVDLPPEESDDLLKYTKQAGISMIFLASPTTFEKRLRYINQISSSFIYYISRKGVTGSGHKLSKSLKDEILNIKKIITYPLAVGFGISNTKHILEIKNLADGIVIGSALVDIIAKHKQNASKYLYDQAKIFKNAMSDIN